MARVPARRSRSVLVPPREHCWIESDAYDRSAFEALVAESPSLAALGETGRVLVPHFRELLEDVFCLLFKLTPVWRPADAVAPSAALGGALLAALRNHPLLEHVRSETQLDEVQAGLGTVLVGEELLRLLRQGEIVTRGDLLDLWDLDRQEDEVRRRAEELAAIGAASDAPGRVYDETARAAEVAAAMLRQKAHRVAARLAEIPARGRNALPAATAGLQRQLAEARDHAESWGTGVGAGGRVSAGRRIELGKRLATNPKLKRLGTLVGRMRQLALALRSRTTERPSDEVFAVELSGTIERLLPPELLAVRHPILRRDFTRRLLEGQLLSYHLRGVDDRGRGPMIVCLDGSSSMAGDKEVWGKAVALTLLEIARRQRRLFRFICFSSKDMPLYTLDLNSREHHTVHVDRTLDLAEYFPGGGTDFEAPIDAALATLADARYRRGDVVLITDGESQVSPEWLARFHREKARLEFSLFSILIDVGGTSDADTLRELSDRLTSVSQLTDDAVRDLFVRL
ncbi:MAG: VWA domain-containing protein [Candidatus Binatia bacterium]